MAYPGVSIQGVGDAGDGVPARANPVRQSKLSYGQELRAQMEADNARRLQQQRAVAAPVETPPVGFPRGRPAVAENRLPGIRGATPPQGGRAEPVVGARRPRSDRSARDGRRANAAGGQGGSRSPQLLDDERRAPARFGRDGNEGGAGQRVLEQEVQHLTHQVQELLVGLHGRVLMLEQDLSSSRRDKDALTERLQGLELDNVALRAEVKVLAPGERVANLERDMTQKLHAHLEHVTSVESERVAAALQRIHQMQLDAQEDRRKSQLSQQLAEQHQQTIAMLEERLKVVESSEALGLRQQMQDHEARRTETARMEMRIYELEAALRTLSAKGEQVVRDTGDAMRSMVQNSSAAVLQQLQLNVNALSTQMKVVEQELLLRGSEIAHRTEEEGKQRQRSLAELEKMISAQLLRVESEMADLKDSRLALERATREGDEQVLSHVRATIATIEESAASNVLRMDAAVQRMRNEYEEDAARKAEAAEEARGFLEEVLRAEIRGRLQGQEALAKRVMEMEEVSRGEGEREKEYQATFTLLKLLQAKAKAHSKSLRMLGAELDSFKRTAKGGEDDLEARIRVCAQGLKELEDKAEKDGALRTLAAREELAVVEARVRGLEDGRGEILDKITREVDANRLADNERAKDVSERIEGLQRALDACVDMCQSDLRDLHESHVALEHRLDREAEGLEGLLDRTARDLTRSLDSKLQGSMKEAVASMATELQAEIGALRSQQNRADGEYKELRLRIETQRQALEHKISAAQHQVEEAEARANMSLKRIKDEISHNSEVYNERFDALDEQLHVVRAQSVQHKTEAVERDTLLDGKLRRLEQELLFSGGVGQAQSVLRLLDVAQPFDILAPTPPPGIGLDDGTPLKGGKMSGEADMKGGGLGYGTKTLAGGETRGGVIGNLQGEIEALRRHVLQELQDVNQKIAEGSERTSDTRRQLGETEERLGQRSDTVWEETRQQWEAVSKLLDNESKALQEQLAVQRRVEQEHRNELDAAIRAEAEARAAAATAAANALEAATLALGKRIDGVGGVEAHVNEARAAANEAIADLRQQLADETSRREELGHMLEARVEEAEKAVELAERRNRELVINKDGDAKAREDAVLAALQRVKTGVEQLGVRAEGMEQQQLRHTKDLADRHAEVTRALNAAARHTMTIADAHRRDIDRVDRERECATVLAELVARTAELALEERLKKDSSKVATKFAGDLEALKTEMVTKAIPKTVKEEVGELVELKILPLKYTLEDLELTVRDNETQAVTFHDSVNNKLAIIESTIDTHSTQHQAHIETATKADARMQQIDATIAQQKATHIARLDEAEMNLRDGAAAAALEGMLRSLQATDEKASDSATLRALNDRLSELGDRLGTLSASTSQQINHLQSKLAETEDLTTHLSEMAADETSDEELKSLKEELSKVAGTVKKFENELEALLAGGVTSPVVLGSPAKSSREQAREERALLGGGDMDTIDEEEPVSPAPVYSPSLRRGGDGERGEESAEAGGKDTDGKTSAEPGADAGGSGASAEAKGSEEGDTSNDGARAAAVAGYGGIGGKGTNAAEAKDVQEKSEGAGDGDKAKAGGEEKSAKEDGAGVDGEPGDKVKAREDERAKDEGEKGAKAGGEENNTKDGGAEAQGEGGDKVKAGGEDEGDKDGGAGEQGTVGDKDAKAGGEKSSGDGGEGQKGEGGSKLGEKGDASKEPRGE